MRAQFSKKFERDYAKVPPFVQKAFDKKLTFIIKNLRHPSLHAKKFEESGDIWQARVTKSYRFYFRIEGSIYRVISITEHPKK